MGNTRYYHRIFFAANGFGPYTCFHCGQPVYFDEVIIHHLDHDHWNDDPDNLAAAHPPCHISHHHNGKAVTAHARLNMSRSHSGARLTAEHRRNIGLSLIGREIPQAARDKASLTMLAKPQFECSCGKRGYHGPLARHANAQGHEVQGEVA